MKTIMLLGFAGVVLGCFIGDVPMVLICAAAQAVGTFGLLGEMRG